MRRGAGGAVFPVLRPERENLYRATIDFGLAGQLFPRLRFAVKSCLKRIRRISFDRIAPNGKFFLPVCRFCLAYTFHRVGKAPSPDTKVRLRITARYLLCFLKEVKYVEMDANTTHRKIILKDRGRFFSYHAGGTIYHDSRHRVFQVPVEGGYVFELVQERQLDGSFRNQLLTTRGPTGSSVIEY